VAGNSCAQSCGKYSCDRLKATAQVLRLWGAYGSRSTVNDMRAQIDDGRRRRNVWARQGGRSPEHNRMDAASTGGSSYAFGT
jgi:hypothetical protein